MVVLLYLVDVVNHFTWQQRTPQAPLCDRPVLVVALPGSGVGTALVAAHGALLPNPNMRSRPV